MSKLKWLVIFGLGAHILFAVLAAQVWFNGESLERLVVEWGFYKVVFSAVLLVLAGIGILYLMFRDAKRIGDERENSIDLKSYRVAFHIQTIAYLGLLIGSALAPASSPVYVMVAVIIIAASSRVFALAYFRKVS